VACEDTRVSGRLLHHLGVKKPLVSLHEHNERQRLPRLLAELESGKTVALASDAGTPLLSDPGFVLVREAAARGIAVEPIPGPSALLAALVASALPPYPFTFAGLLRPRAANGGLLSPLAGWAHPWSRIPASPAGEPRRARRAGRPPRGGGREAHQATRKCCAVRSGARGAAAQAAQPAPVCASERRRGDTRCPAPTAPPPLRRRALTSR
jgi:16S rRNA (cytidine1402-2'-O)-methyltransferase